MAKDIRHSWLLKHSPETVWDYLTDGQLLAQWLMKNDFKAVPGHKFRFTAEPVFKFGFDGTVYGEVLEVKPFEKLSYSWRGGPGGGKITLDSVVIWTLRPEGGGTRLTLEHKGFAGLRNFMGYFTMNQGWKLRIVRRLEQLLNAAI